MHETARLRAVRQRLPKRRSTRGTPVQDLHLAVHYAGVKRGVASDADDCTDSRRA
jgi:hypothetical protein